MTYSIDVIDLFDTDALPYDINDLCYCSISFEDLFRKLEISKPIDAGFIIEVYKPNGDLSHTVDINKCLAEKINGTSMGVLNRITVDLTASTIRNN